MCGHATGAHTNLIPGARPSPPITGNMLGCLGTHKCRYVRPGLSTEPGRLFVKFGSYLSSSK